MQPFQYDLRSSAAKDNSITHAAAAPSNLDAATTMRFAAWVAKPIDLSTDVATPNQQSCSHSNAGSPPKLQETHRFTHTGTTTRCKTHREQFATEKTAAAPAAHTRYLSSPAAATLHGKTQGFVLRLPPHNIAHATFMQPFQCDLPPQRQETHRTTHTGTTTRCKTHRRNRLNSKRSKPQPPHRRGTFHRRLKPLYTEKHKVSCSGFLPTT